MKKIILSLLMSLSLSLAGQGLVLQPAYAACAGDNTAKGQVQAGIGATGSDCSGSGVTDFIGTVVNIISIIAGVAAVIMILVSGFKYMTSAGDSSKVSSAKATLIYALIGLAIAVLAQFLVRVVITESNKATLPTCQKGQDPKTDNCAKRP